MRLHFEIAIISETKLIKILPQRQYQTDTICRATEESPTTAKQERALGSSKQVNSRGGTVQEVSCQ